MVRHGPNMIQRLPKHVSIKIQTSSKHVDDERVHWAPRGGGIRRRANSPPHPSPQGSHFPPTPPRPRYHCLAAVALLLPLLLFLPLLVPLLLMVSFLQQLHWRFLVAEGKGDFFRGTQTRKVFLVNFLEHGLLKIVSVRKSAFLACE